MTHLTVEEFRDALQKGLGRAAMYVREHGTENVRNDILHACLNNIAYDHQCEESRANWLLEIIKLTNDEEYYHQRILEALPNSTDLWDTKQLVELAAALARRGLDEARLAIYDKFALQEFEESWIVGSEIVELDGIEGLLHVAEVVGARLLKEPDFREYDYLVTEAIERFDKETVMAAIEKRASENANVRAYLDEIVKHSEAVSNTHRSRPTLKDILSRIETGDVSFSGNFPSFGFRASDEDIEYIFSRLLAETNRDKLIQYLWIFTRRRLPKIDRRLFDLAETNDKDLQEAAIVALAHTQDKSVRDLGIRLLREQPTSIYQRGIKLFIKNYEPGDYQLIESVLPVLGDDYRLHAIGFDLIDLVEAQEDLQLASCCRWVYEQTPCSLCREKIVKAMLATERFPETLLQECRWDCSTDIRALTNTSPQPSP